MAHSAGEWQTSTMGNKNMLSIACMLILLSFLGGLYFGLRDPYHQSPELLSGLDFAL